MLKGWCKQPISSPGIQPEACSNKQSTNLIPPHISALQLTAALFDSISACYLPTFTSKWEILQALFPGSTLLMLFEVHVFSPKNILLLKAFKSQKISCLFKAR